MLVNIHLFVVNLFDAVDHGFCLQDEQVLNAFAWDSWYNIMDKIFDIAFTYLGGEKEDKYTWVHKIWEIWCMKTSFQEYLSLMGNLLLWMNYRMCFQPPHIFYVGDIYYKIFLQTVRNTFKLKGR